MSRRLRPIYVMPWILCVGAILVATWLNGGLGYYRPILGFADGEQVEVATLDGGKLAEILVLPGQEVGAGQLLARLDTASIDAELEVARAEAAALRARNSVTLDDAQQQQLLDERKLVLDVDAARISLAREQAALAEATSRRDALGLERKRLQGLVAEQLATADELPRIELAFAAADREVQEMPQAIALLEAQLRTTEGLLKRAPHREETSLETSLTAELEVVESRIALLEKRRKSLELRAPVAGRVVALSRRQGEVVIAGTPVLSLVRDQIERVTACVAEQDALTVRPGDIAHLRERGTGRYFKGKAVVLGQLVDQVPLRCRRVPTVPAWGRDIIIQLDQPAEVVAGEAFEIQFEHSSMQAATQPTGSSAGQEASPGGLWSLANELPGGAPVANASPKTAAKPVVMDTSALSGIRYNLEPSGLVWLPSLERYLLISDDPGTEQSGKHIPVLFTLTREGRVDSTPIPVRGIDQLDDLESITLDERGRVIVLSSQSLNRKGKRSNERCAMLRLVLEGRELRVEKSINLAGLLEQATAEQRTALGLAEGLDALNIEGMTWHDGALYLGLKGPLDASSTALIWRIGNPDRLFEAGADPLALEVAELSLWAKVKLDARVDDGQVPGGISELLFLEDGSLLLTSTPSHTKEGRQSGKLWRVEKPQAGTLIPQQLREFDGFKPEGLSQSASPGRIVVAFDTAGTSPAWMELPWPG